ncbi:hypothetical protein NUACC21_06070 [Scytonema sp. NUACC21]
MSFELEKVINTILPFASRKVIDIAQRQENVIKILEKLKLDPHQIPSDFEGVYVYALVEYGVGKSEAILNFWREKEIKSKFWQAFNDNPANFINDAENFIDWNILGDKIRVENLDIRAEITEFYQVFCNVAKRSRKPGEIVIDPKFQNLTEQLPYPDEFKSLIEEKLKSFCGRQFVFAEFQKFQQTHSKGYFTLVGDAGTGKSTIAAKYVSQNNCPCYFNILAERRNRPEDFLKSIRQQLIQRYGFQGADNTNLQELLVKASQKHFANKKNPPLVIVVDALDEVDQPDGAENILYLPEYLPEGVYFFLTRRPYADVQKRLRLQVPEKELDLTAEEYQNLNLKDVKTRIQSFLNDPAYQKDLQKWIADRHISQDDFITEVAAKSENNFMYLRYVLPEIAGGFYKDLTLDKLPNGLKSYYQQHWVRMGMEKQSQKIQFIILYIIVEWNTPPISLSDLAEISGKDKYEVEEILEKWREYIKVQILDEDGEEEKCYRVYHASFLDFLKNQGKLDKNRKIFEEVNQRIASYLY